MVDKDLDVLRDEGIATTIHWGVEERKGQEAIALTIEQTRISICGNSHSHKHVAGTLITRRNWGLV